MNTYIHSLIERQTSFTIKCLDKWMMCTLLLMQTDTHFPTVEVQSSERLPVITTAIDQSDQRKLEVDWPGCFTEEWGCFSDFLTQIGRAHV